MTLIASTGRGTVAIAAVIAMALLLSGCGRKGGLDLPSSASETDAQLQAGAPAPNNDPQRNIFGGAQDAGPTAAKGQKRPFILDPLLD